MGYAFTNGVTLLGLFVLSSQGQGSDKHYSYTMMHQLLRELDSASFSISWPWQLMQFVSGLEDKSVYGMVAERGWHATGSFHGGKWGNGNGAASKVKCGQDNATTWLCLLRTQYYQSSIRKILFEIIFSGNVNSSLHLHDISICMDALGLQVFHDPVCLHQQRESDIESGHRPTFERVLARCFYTRCLISIEFWASLNLAFS